jgi:glycosyltransferase involved in cell wall biosynthesis
MVKESNKNKVTIVIPTFNREKFVVKTIDSALKQTVKCDIIVCDHGSRDNTPNVMKKYAGKIKYIRREDDFGPHYGWLEGILHAKTELVHIHYDDDLMEPTFIEKTLKLMSDDVGMVCVQAKTFDYDKNQFTKQPTLQDKELGHTGKYNSSVFEKLFLKKFLTECFF